jgi:dTDP-4-dehydrorhamnose reductase
LGAELVRLAPAQGWEVVATYFARRPEQLAAESVSLDIRDEVAVARTLAEIRPAAVIHTAYRQEGADLWKTTAAGAGAVASAARRLGARLVHLSSDAVFDGERVGSYREDDPVNPITAYGQAKAAAERLVAEEHPGALIARTSLIYGGAELSKHERLILDAADGRATIAFFHDELRCPVMVTDLALALVELTPGDMAGPLHLGGADIVSRYEFAQLVARAHGRAPERLQSTLSAEHPPPRPRNCALDSGRARSMLRTRLRGVREVFQ